MESQNTVGETKWTNGGGETELKNSSVETDSRKVDGVNSGERKWKNSESAHEAIK